jgi:hypothetical protein
MSLILAGRKRTYLLVLFSERLPERCRLCPAVFERSTTPLALGTTAVPSCPASSGVARTLHVSRAVGARLFGFRFTVVRFAA